MTTSDDHMITEIGMMLEQADPVPDMVTEYAKAGYGWRDLDAELAELVFDSAEAGLVGVRGSDTTRQMTFRAPGVEIEVEVLSTENRRIIGQLVPPQELTVELRHGDQVIETTSDSLGRFRFDDVPTGPVSLRCRIGEGHTIRTDWMLW
jgi:hypothetical protein